MNFSDVVNEICKDCKTKESAIERLHDFGLIDVRGVKYLLIHKRYMEILRTSESIMEAMHVTAIEYKISISQVQIIRKYWQQRKRRSTLEIEI